MQIEVRDQPLKGGTRRILHIRDMPGDDIVTFFDFIGETEPAPLALLDGFVHAAFFRAMSIGGELRVHGPVSRQALINLMEVQDLWLSYRTGLFRPITIIPDEIVDVAPRVEPLKAIAAFSGGLDSMFTLLRHCSGPPDGIRIPLAGALFIDRVRHERDTRNQPLLDRIRPVVDQLNVPLAIVRTNLELVPDANQNYSVAARLSANLHCFAGRFSHGLIASSEPYRALFTPWGSSPLDHLFSTGEMTIVHDGAAFCRTEKAALIAQNATALRVLHVCQRSSPENCGRCDKCVRTRLNFLAAGVPEPTCMPGPLKLELIDGLAILSAVGHNELLLIAKYAEEKGLQGEWLDRFRQRLDRYRPATRLKILRKEWPLAVKRRLKMLRKAVGVTRL